MASGPITSWEIDGKTVETVSDFIILGSKITTDGDCSHEIKRRLLWETGIETRIISYMKRVASPGSMHDTGCLGLVHWDDPEGWYGEGGGRRVQDGYHMYTCGIFILI